MSVTTSTTSTDRAGPGVYRRADDDTKSPVPTTLPAHMTIAIFNSPSSGSQAPEVVTLSDFATSHMHMMANHTQPAASFHSGNHSAPLGHRDLPASPSSDAELLPFTRGPQRGRSLSSPGPLFAPMTETAPPAPGLSVHHPRDSAATQTPPTTLMLGGHHHHRPGASLAPPSTESQALSHHQVPRSRANSSSSPTSSSTAVADHASPCPLSTSSSASQSDPSEPVPVAPAAKTYSRGGFLSFSAVASLLLPSRQLSTVDPSLGPSKSSTPRRRASASDLEPAAASLSPASAFTEGDDHDCFEPYAFAATRTKPSEHHGPVADTMTADHSQITSSYENHEDDGLFAACLSMDESSFSMTGNGTADLGMTGSGSSGAGCFPGHLDAGCVSLLSMEAPMLCSNTPICSAEPKSSLSPFTTTTTTLPPLSSATITAAPFGAYDG
jgi:hypothetical protein